MIISGWNEILESHRILIRYEIMFRILSSYEYNIRAMFFEFVCPVERQDH